MRRFTIQLMACLCFFSSAAAHAVLALDQSYALGTESAGLGIVTTTDAQVFEVGQAGLLDSFEVQIQRNSSGSGALRFDILTVLGGVPTTTSLATVIAPHTDVPMASAWFNVNVSSAGIVVSSGDLLAVGLSTSKGSNYSWKAGFSSIPILCMHRATVVAAMLRGRLAARRLGTSTSEPTLSRKPRAPSPPQSCSWALA